MLGNRIREMKVDSYVFCFTWTFGEPSTKTHLVSALWSVPGGR